MIIIDILQMIIALVGVGLVLALIKNIKELNAELDRRSDLINEMIKETHKLNFLIADLEKLRKWVEIISSMKGKKVPAINEKTGNRRPSNTKPRTQEQKKLVSEQMKAYWAKRKSEQNMKLEGLIAPPVEINS